jgi:glycosyltransferase involved in cell wall biosynthesis
MSDFVHSITLFLNIILITIMFAILGVWIYLICYLIKSYLYSPRLKDSNMPRFNKFPKVSVILPARNEEKYIAECLRSIANQDYPNFEIIVINDCSADETGQSILRHSKINNKVIAIDAGPKPEGWVGKSWACYQGFKKSTGDLLLFTDADTKHSASLISLSVYHMMEQNLDALTVIPKLLCVDMWTKVTLPMLSIFLHTRFSPLRVNNPRNKTGYFFGSFFVICRDAYEKIGTHEGVKQELIEDGALGRKVKESGFRLKMFRGEEIITAIWARDLNSLWHGLRRLMIPLYSQHRTKTTLMIIAVFFMLFQPFVFLPYSFTIPFLYNDNQTISYLLTSVNVLTISFIILGYAVQSRLSEYQNAKFAFASPIAAAIISFSFISSACDAKKIGAVKWSDRHYTITQRQHPLN